MEEQQALVQTILNVFGAEQGSEWLQRPNHALHDAKPEEAIKTREGGEQVKYILNCISWGGCV